MTMGLLLVTMEPPPAMAEEFHDWYDTEHVPERLALPGFRNATRWVCLHGWPRYLALYDLDSPATLDTPEYRAVSGDRVGPWSRRVLPRTIGRQRIVATQLATQFASGEAELADRPAALVVARYSAPPATEARLPGLVQQRCFRQVECGADGWVVAALDRVTTPAAALDAFGTLDGQPCTALGLYAPYVR